MVFGGLPPVRCIEKVKPERDPQTRDALRVRWWQYAEKRPGLYGAVQELERVVVISRVNAHFSFSFLPTGRVFSEQLIVEAVETFGWFALLQSRAHEVWARFFASSLEDRLRYTSSDCFETFPLPGDAMELFSLDSAGRTCHDTRTEMMQAANQGMTVLYNRFNNPDDQETDIRHLRDLHAAMDQAVLAAYGWRDLYPVAIHEREWEADEGERPGPWRLRWPEADRDEVLARLLDLNRRRHREEAAASVALLEPPRSRRRHGTTAELQASLPIGQVQGLI